MLNKKKVLASKKKIEVDLIVLEEETEIEEDLIDKIEEDVLIMVIKTEANLTEITETLATEEIIEETTDHLVVIEAEVVKRKEIEIEKDPEIIEAVTTEVTTEAAMTDLTVETVLQMTVVAEETSLTEDVMTAEIIEAAEVPEEILDNLSHLQAGVNLLQAGELAAACKKNNLLEVRIGDKHHLMEAGVVMLLLVAI